MSKGKESDISAITRVLPTLYDFRFNDIKQKPEFREANTPSEFIPVDKYNLNSLRVRLNDMGIETSTADIKCVIESEVVPRVNPIVDYFLEAPEYKPTLHGNPIAKLCSTVKVIGSDKWEHYFTKWIVGVVANALDEYVCKNHLCLVLSGAQGTFKTTWLQNLCPAKLRKQYNYCGKLKLDNDAKDVLTLIAENLFVNIDDQLKELNKKDENALKNLITVDQVKYRRPYDPYIMEYPHLASFCASINGLDFLTDVTGSRRFLAFEIESIDISAAQRMDMDQVYAQAKHLLDTGFKYWISQDEAQELYSNNTKFNVVSIEQELVNEYFSHEKPGAYASPSYLTSTAIKALLEERTKQRISPKLLGVALAKLGTSASKNA